MTKQYLTLIIYSIVLFSNNISSKEVIEQSCDEMKLEKKSQAQYKINYKNGDFKALICLGKIHLKNKKYNEAIDYFAFAEKRAQSNNDKIIANLLHGVVLRESNRPEEALEYLNIKMREVGEIKAYKRLFLNEMAENFFLLQRYDDAVNSILNAYDLAGNDDERAFNLDRAAASYASLKNFNKAIEYELKANLAYERLSLFNEYAESGINLASYYLESNDLPAAERTLSKFEKFTRDNGGMYYLAKVLYVGSLFYKRNLNTNLSRAKLDEANKIASEIGAEDLKVLFRGS